MFKVNVSTEGLPPELIAGALDAKRRHLKFLQSLMAFQALFFAVLAQATPALCKQYLPPDLADVSRIMPGLVMFMAVSMAGLAALAWYGARQVQQAINALPATHTNS